MKNYLIQMSLVLIVFLSACGGGDQKAETSEKSEQSEVTEVAVMSYNLDPSQTKVMWRGEVAGVYGHEGLIDVAEGNITVEGEQIVDGKVVIDMTTIQPTDSASYKDEEGRRASDLVGHLSTGDFFLVEEYPTASFVIKSHTGNQLVGDLTIRGITKEAAATITSMESSADGMTAEAELIFNRQDFDVSWVHYMKDMVLSDDIALNMTVVGKP